MPQLDVTYHSTKTDSWGSTGALGVLSPQIGDRVLLDFTSGAASGATSTDPRIAAFSADADCRIVVGEGVTATAANSRKIFAGVTDYAHIPAGHRLSVISAA